MKQHKWHKECKECEPLKQDIDTFRKINQDLINKEWQGLSDEEISDLIKGSGMEDILMFFIGKPMTALMKKRCELTIKFAKAIEQKLKEKNYDKQR